MYKKIFLYLTVIAMWGCQTYKPLDLSLEKDLERWQRQAVGVNSAAEELETIYKESLTGVLSLKKASELALRFNPEFVTAVKELAVAAAVAENAGLWSDPSVGFDASRILNDAEKKWTSGGSVGLSLPINGALRLEKKLAEKQKFAEAASLREKRIELLRSLNSVWFQWSALEQKIALYSEYIRTLSDIVEKSETLAVIGELDTTEVRLLSVELAEARSSLERMIKEQKRLRLEVLQLSGVHPDAPCRLMPEMAIRNPKTGSIQDNLLKLNPELQRLQAQVESADYRYRLELRRQYPDLELSAGYDDDLEERSVPLGVSLTLPLWNRNRQGVAESAAARDVAVSGLKAKAALLESKVRLLCLRYSENSEYAATLEKKVMPLIKRQLDEVIARLKVGEAEILLITEVMERSLDVREKLIDARLGVAEAVNAIDSLTGFEILKEENE